MAACPSCGHQRAYGCAFDCADKQPPDDPDLYRSWADDQARQHARRSARRDY